MERGRIQRLPNFWGVPSIISETGKATDFKIQGRGKAGSGGSADPPKNLELRSEIALSFTSDKCQINGNGHLYNFNTLETTCLH